MKMFFWDQFNKFICDDFGEIPLESKPVLSFNFDELRLVSGLPSDEAWLKVVENKQLLTPDQIIEVSSFIDNKRSQVGELVMAIDSSGKYLGKVLRTDPKFNSIVETQPPTSDPYRFKDGVWVRVYPITETGNFSTEEESFDVVFEPPSLEKTRWSFTEKKWVDSVPIALRIEDSLIEVIQILLQNMRNDLRSFDNENYIDFIKKVALQIENIANTYPEKSAETSAILSRVPQTIEELTIHSKEKKDIDISLAFLKQGIGKATF